MVILRSCGDGGRSRSRSRRSRFPNGGDLSAAETESAKRPTASSCSSEFDGLKGVRNDDAVLADSAECACTWPRRLIDVIDGVSSSTNCNVGVGGVLSSVVPIVCKMGCSFSWFAMDCNAVERA